MAEQKKIFGGFTLFPEAKQIYKSVILFIYHHHKKIKRLMKNFFHNQCTNLRFLIKVKCVTCAKPMSS